MIASRTMSFGSPEDISMDLEKSAVLHSIQQNMETRCSQSLTHSSMTA